MIDFLYQVMWGPRAVRFLRDLRDGKLSRRLHQAAEKLRHNPRPPGCKKLQGRPGYRVRVGDYRLIYEIHDNRLLIVVIDIGDRKDIYR